MKIRIIKGYGKKKKKRNTTTRALHILAVVNDYGIILALGNVQLLRFFSNRRDYNILAHTIIPFQRNVSAHLTGLKSSSFTT